MSSVKQFEGKCVVVTGAAAGIGRATALHFAREGATVFAADIDLPGVERLAGEANGIVPVACNVCEEEQIKALMDRAADTCGGIDILFNNAGAGGAKERIDEIVGADWDRTLALLLRSVAMGIRYATPHMKGRANAVIINTASTAGVGTGDAPIAYSVAKAGVIHLTKCAATELARFQIRVNTILPGFIQTNIFPAGMQLSGEKFRIAQEMIAEVSRTAQPVARSGQPEDIAAAVAFLSSEGASFITGAALYVDGGLSLGQRHAWDPEVPSLLDHLKALVAAPEPTAAP